MNANEVGRSFRIPASIECIEIFACLANGSNVDPDDFLLGTFCRSLGMMQHCFSVQYHGPTKKGLISILIYLLSLNTVSTVWMVDAKSTPLILRPYISRASNIDPTEGR